MGIKEDFDDVQVKELELHNSKVATANSNAQRSIAVINERAAQEVKDLEVKLAQKRVQWAEMDNRIKAQDMQKQFEEAQLRLAELNRLIAEAETKLAEVEQPK